MVKPPDTLVQKMSFYIFRFFWPPYGKQAVEIIRKPIDLEFSFYTQLVAHIGVLSSIMILFFFWYHIRKLYKKQKHARRQETVRESNQSNESIEQTIEQPHTHTCITDMSTQTNSVPEILQTLDQSVDDTSSTSSSKPQKPNQKEAGVKLKRGSERKWKL